MLAGSFNAPGLDIEMGPATVVSKEKGAPVAQPSVEMHYGTAGLNSVSGLEDETFG